jgi:hypothetical protein
MGVMKWNKNKAAKISQKWEVSAATIRTWKHRGEIPDDYQHDPVFLFIAMRKLDSEYISAFEQTIERLVLKPGAIGSDIPRKHSYRSRFSKKRCGSA